MLLKRSKSIPYLLIILITFLAYSGCDVRPSPEKLSISVRSTLNLLQRDPQFVMYFNFKGMRSSDFWKKNVSDSLMNSERTFGSMLNVFKQATGTSISDGLDEMFYSNSWFGENAIVLKGVFNKQKIDDYISKDSTFLKTSHRSGMDLYQKSDKGLYFFLKDNVTICASNYMTQIDAMLAATDTSVTGLASNQDLVRVIEGTTYKNNLWMVSTEKMFIRGIFMNFLGPGGEDTLNPQTQGMNDLYKTISSISFSTDMDDELEMLIQAECTDEGAAENLKKILLGMITVSKLTSAGKEGGSSLEEVLKTTTIDAYDNDVFMRIKVNENNINALRNNSILNKPN